MGTIAQFLNAVQRLNTDMAVDTAIERTKAETIALNRDQLIHGLNTKGERIGRYKNPKYAAKKYAMNPMAGIGNIDLKLTGDFQREMFVDQRFDVLVIGSTDTKTQDLAKHYPEIFGLTPDSRSKYIAALRPAFIQAIKNQLHGR